MVDGGHSLEEALHRAALQHAVDLRRGRPARDSLHDAVREYRQLFRPQQIEQLRDQRRIAAEAMRSFTKFEPQLIGSLVHGDGPLDRIRLLLISDTPEQVIIELSDRRMPCQASEAKLCFSGGRRETRPALHFVAGETRVELILLNRAQRSDPPRDPATGGKLDSLSRGQLDALIAHEGV